MAVFSMNMVHTATQHCVDGNGYGSQQGDNGMQGAIALRRRFAEATGRELATANVPATPACRGALLVADGLAECIGNPG